MSAAWETNTDKIRDRNNTWESGWEYSILFLGLKNKRLFVLWHTISSDFVVFVLVVVWIIWNVVIDYYLCFGCLYQACVCLKWKWAVFSICNRQNETIAKIYHMLCILRIQFAESSRVEQSAFHDRSRFIYKYSFVARYIKTITWTHTSHLYKSRSNENTYHIQAWQ